ncbi:MULTISPECIES: TauD/TfdA dioxygenase family protein [Cupriavidus]|uniref:TauD/TfdA dioxygenase family protein n=1 Tax=Cupriavidus TaxID=106589 RepID=UPI0005B3A48B|nr:MULTISPECIES: TauD/TfdA family dioxygenase [Cupriavidus]MCY0852794.1 TauD/TfdA family dioxygenase [Cupriavidus sp. D39]
MSNIEVRPLGYAAGAEVLGLDLRKPLSSTEVDQVNAAWHQHLVLVFPGQDLTPPQLIEFTGKLGDIERNENVPYYRHPEYPEVLLVTNKQVNGKPSQTRNTGRNWHADLSYTDRPAKGSVLMCKEKPDVGGDTMFANMYMAYETLSPIMQKFVDGLEAVHDITLIKGFNRRDPAQVADLKAKNPPIVHPLVRVHPDTGRKSLFVSERVRNFVGMTEEESQPILDFLNMHATSPEFVYRHRWNLNDVVMWDNRCTLHIALKDFDQSQPRHMMRCSMLGEKSGYVLPDEHEEGSAKSALVAVS